MTKHDEIKNDENQIQSDEKNKSWWDAFRAEWRNAFSMKVDENQFNEKDMILINDVAKDIVSRRLASPAVMFLVTIQPVTFIMAQGMQMVKPFIASDATASHGRDFAEKFALKTLVTQPGAYERLALLLETQEGVEQLINAIEKQEDDRISIERSAKK